MRQRGRPVRSVLLVRKAKVFLEAPPSRVLLVSNQLEPSLTAISEPTASEENYMALQIMIYIQDSGRGLTILGILAGRKGVGAGGMSVSRERTLPQAL